jgi:hypothetical protein
LNPPYEQINDFTKIEAQQKMNATGGQNKDNSMLKIALSRQLKKDMNLSA